MFSPKFEQRALKKESRMENVSLDVCTSEVVSYLAAPSPYGALPQRACPVIIMFMHTWNNSLSDCEDRKRLIEPLIPLAVFSLSTQAVQERRMYLALDWLVRVYTPEWLDMVPALRDEAKKLRELEEISDVESAEDSKRPLHIADYNALKEDRGGCVTGQLSRAALGAAAATAARQTTMAVRWDAEGNGKAWATWDSAWLAAGSAASTATLTASWVAAEDATGAAAKATTNFLQASAVDLAKAMCALTI